jgi:hypothetical protein
MIVKEVAIRAELMKGGSQTRPSFRKGADHTWVDRLFDPVIKYVRGVELMVDAELQKVPRRRSSLGSSIECGFEVHVFHARV